MVKQQPTQSGGQSQKKDSPIVAGTAFLLCFVGVAASLFSSRTYVPTPSVQTQRANSTFVLSSSPRSHDHQFGIAVSDSLSGLSDVDLNKELADIVSLGAEWIRIDIDWSEIQPEDSSSFDWSRIDRTVASARAHHINILAILDYTPPWARLSGCYSNRCQPDDPSRYADFAAAAARRYKSSIHDWEIWNEPNMKDSWLPDADVASYVLFLKAAYAAIKDEDPEATVITGGLGPTDTRDGNIAPVEYLADMYRAGAKTYFDAVAFHPYSFPAPPGYPAPWNAWQQMAHTSPSLRSIMIAHGDASKSIWITEYGAPSGGPAGIASSTDLNLMGHADHVTEELQAKMARDAISEVKDILWSGPLFWYSYKDQGTSSETKENFFGLLRFDGSKKSAYTLLQELLVSQ